MLTCGLVMVSIGVLRFIDFAGTGAHRNESQNTDAIAFDALPLAA